jgi:hypothetical protein
MIRDIQELPWWAEVLGYGLLSLGLVFVLGFLVRYRMINTWVTLTEEGKHLVAMSANIGAFFVVYLVLAIWPDLPRWLVSMIRLTLLVGLVLNCGWRWLLLERYRRRGTRSD